MTTAYTSLLGLALPVQGELTGVWGDTVNNSITSLLDTSVAGTTNVSTDTDVTLTTTTGAANTARQAILLFSGARTALRTVTAPAQSKIYTVINATTGGFSVKLVGVGPTTGVTIVAGESAVCAWNGSDFIKISNTGGSASFVNLTASGTVTFTGLSASQAVFTNASDELVSNAITGTGNVVMSASPTLTGTIDAAAATLSGNLTLSGGTANGVLYLNGSKVVTSGSALTFDGTSLGISTGTNAVAQKWQGAGTNFELRVKANDGSASNASAYRLYLDYLSGTATNGFIDFYRGGGGGDGYLAFGASGSEQMRLTSTGLGIGTSSPAVKLQVNGSLAVGSGQNISWGGAYGAGIPTMAGSASGMDFYPAGSTSGLSMRLDTSGNLGLGVTPSAWGVFKGFDIGSNAAISNGGTFAITSNAYYNGANWIYKSTAVSTLYQQQSGQHQWYNAASGTAGNAITFTQAMTLDASGNLGIGATSPSSWSGAKLVLQTATSTSSQLAIDNISFATGQTMGIDFTVNANSKQAFVRAIVENGTTAATALTFGTASGGNNASERARIDSSGNLLVGTTSAGVADSGADNLIVGPGTGNNGITIYSSNTGNANLNFADTDATTVGFIQYQHGGNNMNFRTNGAEAMRIDSSGNLLVGTTTSHARIAARSTEDAATIIRGDGETAGYYGTVFLANSSRGATTGYNLYDGYANGGLVFRVYGNGNVINTNNSYGAISDSKLKENIVDASPKLADMMQVKVRNYNLIGDTTKQLGVVAQELETVFPAMIDETVDRDAEGNDLGTTTKQVKYSVFVPMLIKAIQEQQAIIESLKARLDAANL